jgi:predicted NUDIX family phosphoesterase
VDREIMVIKREILFSERQFTGFIKVDDYDFQTMILNNYEWLSKIIAEENPSFKQPIGYVVFINKRLKQVFFYMRSDNSKNYSETRLQGKYSIGVGGHIEKTDAKSANPILTSAIREVFEEVSFKDLYKLQHMGYVNNEDKVGGVHFGILYFIETDYENIIPKDPEILGGQFVDMRTLEEICSDTNNEVEEWTKICLEPLRTYLMPQME